MMTYYAGKASGKTANQKLMLKLVGELGWGQEVYDAYAKIHRENGGKAPHRTAIHEQMKRLFNNGFVKRVKKTKKTTYEKLVATAATKAFPDAAHSLKKWWTLPEPWDKATSDAYRAACLESDKAYQETLKRVQVTIVHKVWFYTLTKRGQSWL